MRPKSRIMYIEYKGDDGIAGSARIGRVTFSKSGKSIHYNGKTFETKKGTGFKSNYFDVETGEDYWISGCRKDGRDALYSTDAEIDDDVREEYWTEIRKMPENKHISKMKVMSKY
ncbi:1-deoxy-D-xylulose-5-phosphate synthase [Candidatus Sumerlaeota bacterium]|nr:1-deoxy-D-xylulose-5-phosphate synthase [Candidatus Sumerlaeota bacterium]